MGNYCMKPVPSLAMFLPNIFIPCSNILFF